ncbi:amino acid permease [Arthrospiribacter ruber]|uniref:Amino acid permease n=2 Tax=Arthrospiribacter ruber TaxID=2487934 RepID=A0A951MAL8_9BACT|nr:amino acid permease [Arthrospiribacter ruber]MBW3466704.1 amino acid permease [Arthrospiribacter ruber]
MSVLDKDRIGWKTAAALVVANMVGTGVFTSLGFQLFSNTNTWTILSLWILGGGMALIGAFVYAELGTHFKRSGGDYVFLSQIIHPSVGYIYAWISLGVGFSAPIAIAAMAMAAYWQPIIGPNASFGMGIAVILLISFFHSYTLKQSGRVQNVLTAIKLLFVGALIVLGFVHQPTLDANALDFTSGWSGDLLKPGFAVSLVYVFFAYTGWNSAAYIIGEIKEPSKSLPKALVSASLLVMVLYVLLQLVFLKHARLEDLQGQVDVATVAFGNLFGQSGVFWVSLFIGIQLLATISGYTWVGPRITQAMAQDYRLWQPLAKENKKGIPVRAIWFNASISLLLVLTGSFESVLVYTGLVLQLMGTLTIAASLKVRSIVGFQTPFKPILQYIYIVFSLWVMGFVLYERPMESLFGLGVVAFGAILYLFDSRIMKEE